MIQGPNTRVVFSKESKVTYLQLLEPVATVVHHALKIVELADAATEWNEWMTRCCRGGPQTAVRVVVLHRWPRAHRHDVLWPARAAAAEVGSGPRARLARRPCAVCYVCYVEQQAFRGDEHL